MKENMNLLGFIATVMTENNLDLNTMDEVVEMVNDIALEKYLEKTDGEKKNGAFAFPRSEVEKIVIDSPTLLNEWKKKKAEKKKEDKKPAIAKPTETVKKETPKAKPVAKTVETKAPIFRINKKQLAEYKEQTGLFDE